MFNEKIFAERLKALRTSKGMTLQQVGNCTNSTKSTIGNFENMNKKPSLKMIIKIADCFNVSIDYLIGRVDKPNI